MTHMVINSMQKINKCYKVSMKLCTKSGHCATWRCTGHPTGFDRLRRCWVLTSELDGTTTGDPTRLAECTSQRCLRPSEAPTSLQETYDYEAFTVDDVVEAAELDRCSMISRCTTRRAVLQSGVRWATSASNAAGLLWRAVTWSAAESEARAALNK
jgi:hypothetical protein